ncbi:phytoene desaturase family protein [Marinoscillum furvescens]|uniref:Phytoene dehydrogenase-like protein n=1 Tax=Marinoscillum furvescens DSM 4134 TaxID=1122208 RepID=A0A3D9L8Q3_MARFU|nr:NAD(P)/FAD-dependent oxidoreductase [Marinoscillum furvescens]REE01257.1 phytoene dehydrogenase-like protein [Marinoscillum furvescens DSM 4134]
MCDVIVIGSGMGSLTAAAMLALKGLQPLILEQNWIPGGCTTSYPRKGYTFEAGATTLVGLDDHMPLRYLLDATGIALPSRKLDLPMQVHLTNGQTLSRFQDLDRWIAECDQKFGVNSSAFWQEAYTMSKFVWQASTRYLHFPPERTTDYLRLLKKMRLNDVANIPAAWTTTEEVLIRHHLNTPDFRAFIDQQLLITAQNTAEQVNWLFGAAALCYTNYGNYYIDGGLRNLVNPLVEYITSQGGNLQLREPVVQIEDLGDQYQVTTKNTTYHSKYLVSGIPLNNLLDHCKFPVRYAPKVMKSEQLYSAFQMGIAYKPHNQLESLHHQIHITNALSGAGSSSIFLSLSHPEDTTRSPDPDTSVASISTHIPNPKHNIISTEEWEQQLLNELARRDIIRPENIVYQHSSGPRSWHKWTGRAHGFVGGYPQYKHIKPWQMVGARLDLKRAYHCGDTAYPGQGIPGATLSGIIAATKLTNDWL